MNKLRKVQFYEVPRAECIYRTGNLRQVKLNHRPTCGREENLHWGWRGLLAASGGSQTLFGVAQSRLHLFAGHAREPFEEIIHPRTTFQVLKQRLNRHSCALENPGAANFPRRPFDGSTLTPIKHKRQLYRQTPGGKFASRRLNTDHALKTFLPFAGYVAQHLREITPRLARSAGQTFALSFVSFPTQIKNSTSALVQ